MPLESSDDSLKPLVPATHVGDPKGILAAGFHDSLELAMAGITFSFPGKGVRCRLLLL